MRTSKRCLMQRRQILKSIPFFLSLCASAAYAQNRLSDVEERFDIAAGKHERELQDLWGSPRIPLISLRNLGYYRAAQSIAGILAVTAEDRQGWRERTYPDGTSVLFYSYSEENFQVWLVSDLGIQAYHQRDLTTQQLNEAITNLRTSLNLDSLQRSRMPSQISNSERVLVNSDTRASQAQAIADLTQILLPTPIATELNAVKHLIVVPALETATVPYAILKPFRDNSFLIDRMSVSIAMSLFDVGQTLRAWDLSNLFTSPLIVGNPYLPENMYWSVPPLPGAEQEAQAVAAMMDVAPLIGREATKAEVLSRAEEASLLYLAAHGATTGRGFFAEGFLMLSAEQFEQGWWTAEEIQSTPLKASIAVLSACQTGLEEAHDAGVIKLARAIQIAGVPQVVMSLWSIDDAATSTLMQAFVKHLETQIPSEALRQAMLEVRQDYPDPSQWASFVMFGTPR